MFGTNPMAFAWPRHNKPPLVFDQAASASARGEIQLRLRDGKSLPEGWAIGSDGKPTTIRRLRLPSCNFRSAASKVLRSRS